MNAGLRYLLWAGIRGVMRRAGRRMRTFRGFVSAIIGLLFFVFVVASQLMALQASGGVARQHDPVMQGFSLALLLFMIPALVAADAPFYWPQEVQFLFPAPLRRRELLLYALVSRGWVQLFSGIWLGLVGMRMAVRPAAAIPAVMLAVLWLFVLTQLAGLLKLAVGDRLPPTVARAVRPALYAGIAVAGWLFYREAQEVGFGMALGDLIASRGVQLAMLPARPFAETYAAETAGAVLAWSAASVALVMATAGAALLMRVDFRERSLVSSARRFERIRRMRRGRGGLASAAVPRNRWLPVPSFAFLGAAAPIARRQAYELGRGLQTLGALAFMAGMAFFYVIGLPRWLGSEGSGELGTSLVVLAVAFPLFGTGSFSVDFRRDVERIGYLRSLPLRPVTVAVGEVFVAAAIIALVNLLLLGIAVWMVDAPVEPRMGLLAAAVALPVAWLAVTLENWLFLLFPTRMQADGGQQSAFVGKQLIKLFFKLVLLGIVVVAAGLMGMAGGWVADTAGAAAGAVIVVALACWGATLLLARAYQSFDLTVDTPA
ncbi:putative ABC exporter domain-containing protein [Longimicrobium sp.]|uniref:putative ABC exporter domain-containing protein n=1 Tax=Longimicrobium sp. TaxID=2029185 RepID=UPI003B3B3504